MSAEIGPLCNLCGRHREPAPHGEPAVWATVGSADVVYERRLEVVEREDHRVILNEVCFKELGEEEHGGRRHDGRTLVASQAG
jgi:hypothetical protein